jgi:hypothetical protein
MARSEPKRASHDRPAADEGRTASGVFPGVVAALLVNAVYIAGVLFHGTSATTLMLLFWLETALAIGSHHVLMSSHRPLPGEPRPAPATMTINGRPRKVPWRVAWLWTVLPFTLVHGLLVLMLALLPFDGLIDDPGWRVQWAQVGQGALLLGVFAIGGLYVGLRALAKQSFAALRATVERDTARVFVLHIGIVLGMFVVAWFGIATGPLLVIVALKAMVDVAVALGGSHTPVPTTRDSSA